MKQLITFAPTFSASNKTVDFSAYPGFQVSRLYALINVTRNQPIYVAGAPGLGISSLSAGGRQITLAYDTTSYADNDLINVYYDTNEGIESNRPNERGGQTEAIQETLNQILVELQLQSIIMAQGFQGVALPVDDVQKLRDDMYTPGNFGRTDAI